MIGAGLAGLRAARDLVDAGRSVLVLTGARGPGFPALPGYDLASGVGTINAAPFVPELAGAAG